MIKLLLSLVLITSGVFLTGGILSGLLKKLPQIKNLLLNWLYD